MACAIGFLKFKFFGNIYIHISRISGKDIDILRNRSFFLSMQLTFCPQIVKSIMNK